jgi:hypothetical protein
MVEEPNVVVLLLERLYLVFDELVELAQNFLDVIGDSEVHGGCPRDGCGVVVRGSN